MPTRRGRLICWRKELTLSGALLVVEQGKIVQLEIGDVVAVLVGDGEDEVDFVDAQPDGGRCRRPHRCSPARPVACVDGARSGAQRRKRAPVAELGAADGVGAGCCACKAATQLPQQVPGQTTFDSYPSYSTNLEIERKLLSGIVGSRFVNRSQAGREKLPVPAAEALQASRTCR